MFDLGREDVDPANDEHVIGTAGDLGHTHKRPTAGAWGVDQPGDVLCAIADDREGLLCQGGKDQFSLFTDRKRIKGVTVHDLGQEMVFKDVQAVLSLNALRGHTRPDDFAQAVNINGLDIEFFLKFRAHLLAPWLGAEDPDTQRQFGWIDSHLHHDFRQVEGV